MLRWKIRWGFGLDLLHDFADPCWKLRAMDGPCPPWDSDVTIQSCCCPDQSSHSMSFLHVLMFKSKSQKPCGQFRVQYIHLWWLHPHFLIFLVDLLYSQRISILISPPVPLAWWSSQWTWSSLDGGDTVAKRSPNGRRYETVRSVRLSDKKKHSSPETKSSAIFAKQKHCIDIQELIGVDSATHKIQHGIQKGRSKMLQTQNQVQKLNQRFPKFPWNWEDWQLRKPHLLVLLQFFF